MKITLNDEYSTYIDLNSSFKAGTNIRWVSQFTALNIITLKDIQQFITAVSQVTKVA